MPKERVWGRLRRFAGWAWFVAGLTTVALAILFAALTASFVHKAVETGGTVVSLTPVQDEENYTTSYAPISTFTADDRTYTITSSTATSPSGFTKGEAVRVLYDPQNPTHARLKSTAQLWMPSMICAPLGAFLTVIGGTLIYFDRRRNRR